MANGTGKSHLAVAIARACIRSGRRGRFFNVVDLVNKLDAEARGDRQGRTADILCRLDVFAVAHRARTDGAAMGNSRTHGDAMAHAWMNSAISPSPRPAASSCST